MDIFLWIHCQIKLILFQSLMWHNCNGREEQMNQIPGCQQSNSESSLGKRQVFQVENSLKCWNIKDH